MQRLKRLLWNLFPYDIEVAIRSILEPAFRKKHMLLTQKVEHWVSEIDSREKKAKISVVFFCHFPAVWNAVASTFHAASEDPAFDVHLLALPNKISGQSGDDSIKNNGENSSYRYCRQFFPNTINAFNEREQTWFDLKKLKPDYVILSRPYDKEIHFDYQASVLASYTKICYIPYSYCKMKWDSRLVYNCDFVDYVYAIFTEHPMYQRMVQRIYQRLFKATQKKILYLGYPRFDLYQAWEKNSYNDRKTILWLPRWTSNDLLEPSTFFQYKNILFEFVKAHPGLHLICRPHPLMFANFVSTGQMTKLEADSFRKSFEETENFTLDESGDYIPAFASADIFISDTSSLIIEEFITGKPIIFCGSMAHFDKNASQWAKLMYPVADQKELLNRLGDLLNGYDPYKASRESYIDHNLKCVGTCGKRIIDFMKADYNINPSKE